MTTKRTQKTGAATQKTGAAAQTGAVQQKTGAAKRALAVAAAALAAAVGLTVGSLPAQAQPRDASAAVACPALAELPAGADPAQWRCEQMAATGRLELGRIDEAMAMPIRLTFAEGRLHGEYAQVFAGMEARPIRLGHTPWSVTPRYAGRSDFQSDEERRGELDLAFTVRGPGLRRGCSIGTDAAPIHLVLKDTVPTEVVSQSPLTVTFTAADTAFTAPRTTGCGRLARLVDHALRLPSRAGANALTLAATVTITPYG